MPTTFKRASKKEEEEEDTEVVEQGVDEDELLAGVDYVEAIIS